jgi:GNAT superfamily N-acetyltransferase
MTVSYRPARQEDLGPAMGVVHLALNDLLARHGFETIAAPPGFEFDAFSVADDPDGAWVAEDAGQVVGVGIAWTCGAFWFLADLFVLPQYQGNRVGQGLIARALDHAGRRDASNRALITFAYNGAALGMYVKHGLYPREPLYRVSAGSETLVATQASDVSCVALEGTGQELGVLTAIDEACLGFSREKHHRFLQGASGMRGFILKHDGGTIGYAYLSSGGDIGPLAVISAGAMGSAFSAMLALAKEQGTPGISAFLGGSNEQALSIAVRSGMRIVRPMVLLSAKAFGDWTRYAPSNAGFM